MALLFVLGATRSASLRACPWLSYSAPLALRISYFVTFGQSPARRQKPPQTCSRALNSMLPSKSALYRELKRGFELMEAHDARFFQSSGPMLLQSMARLAQSGPRQ